MSRTEVCKAVSMTTQKIVADVNRTEGTTFESTEMTFDDLKWSLAANESGLGGANNISDMLICTKENDTIVQLNTGQVRPTVVKTNTMAVRMRAFHTKRMKEELITVHEFLSNPSLYSMRGVPAAPASSLLQNASEPDKEENIEASFKVLYVSRGEEDEEVQFTPCAYNYGTCNGDDPQNLMMTARKNDTIAMQSTTPMWARMFPRKFEDGVSKRVFVSAKDTGVKAQATAQVDDFSEEDREQLMKHGFSEGDDIFVTFQIPLKQKGLRADLSKRCAHFRGYKSAEDDEPCYRSLGDSVTFRSAAPTNIAKLESGDAVEPKGLELSDPTIYTNPLTSVKERGPGDVRMFVTKVVVVSGKPTEDDVKAQLNWLKESGKLGEQFTDKDWKESWKKMKEQYETAYPGADPNPKAPPAVKHCIAELAKEEQMKAKKAKAPTDFFSM